MLTSVFLVFSVTTSIFMSAAFADNFTKSTCLISKQRKLIWKVQTKTSKMQNHPHGTSAGEKLEWPTGWEKRILVQKTIPCCEKKKPAWFLLEYKCMKSGLIKFKVVILLACFWTGGIPTTKILLFTSKF